jgi:hypothetical protein
MKQALGQEYSCAKSPGVQRPGTKVILWIMWSYTCKAQGWINNKPFSNLFPCVPENRPIRFHLFVCSFLLGSVSLIVSLGSKIVWPLRQSTSKLYFWKRYFLDIKQRSVTQYYSDIQWDAVYSNIALPRASAFTLLVDEGIRWLKYWCIIQWTQFISKI